MTPSNQDNQQPLIYRICDSAGVFHLVAPVNHHHSQNEIDGLAASLAAKQDTLTFDTTPTENSTNPVTSGGVKAALDGKRTLVGQTISLVISGQEIEIESSDVPNLIRALSNPDSTPIANSNKLVTSGGVKSALDDKQETLTFDSTPTTGSTNPVTSSGVKNALDGKADQNHMHSSIGDEESSITVGEGEINIELSDPVTHSGGELNITVSKLPNLQRATNNPDRTPTANSDNLVTSGGVKIALDGKAPEGDTDVIFEEGENIFVYLPNYFTNGERQRSFILNYQGNAAELIELFGGDANDTIRILSHDDSTITVGECYIAVRVIKQTGGSTQGDAYYIIFDGKNEY